MTLRVACIAALAASSVVLAKTGHRPATKTALQAEPNPPTWPASVHVFTPETPQSDMQDAINAAHATNGGNGDVGQFSTARYAFMFGAGQYPGVEVPVGYYTSVYGLGDSPLDTVFSSAKGVYCEEGNTDYTDGALNTFWRSAENFANNASYSWWDGASGMLWAVSQAAPLRRVQVKNDLLLFQVADGNAGYSSGGYLGNSVVAGALQTGSQQQWLTRNSQIDGGSPNGNWNMVYVGCEGAPAAQCGNWNGPPNVVVDKTPSAIAEKPFVTMDGDGLFSLVVPEVAQAGRVGADWWPTASTDPKKVPFDQVYVADNNTDTADSINAKLGSGLHVVLAPGIYQLDAPLKLETEGQVLLGLGFATLVSANGTSCIEVGDVDGVRVAGVLLEAGPKNAAKLLSVGTENGAFQGKKTNPIVLSDIFARVGGPADPAVDPVAATAMVVVHAGNVIGDNLWLWRADHYANGAPVKDGDNPCDHGIQVYGDFVTMYGLAVEHTLKDLAQWFGNYGATYFYQSELPYDVTQAQFGDPGYTSYRLGENVTNHEGQGVGVYHFFRDYPVTVASGIVTKDSIGGAINFAAPLGVYLSGQGTMTHVLDDQGGETGPAEGTGAQWVC